VCQQVFEEAAVDLGRALEAFSSGRKGERTGKKPRFPKFKRKATARQAFRLRNKGAGKAAAIRVGEGEQARVVRLPKLGSLRVRECTRRLRRMLRKDRAKISVRDREHARRGALASESECPSLAPASRTVPHNRQGPVSGGH